MAYFNEKLVSTQDVQFVTTDSMLVPVGTEAQKVLTGNGRFRYNSDTLQFEGYSNGAWGAVGGSTEKAINQGTHGFAVGTPLYFDTTYQAADNDTLAKSHVVGIVKTVIDADNFILITEGYMGGFTGLTANVQYFLSDTAGTATATKPTSLSNYDVELYYSISTTEAYVKIGKPVLNETNWVDNTTTETIAGVKTFSSAPIVTDVATGIQLNGGTTAQRSGSPVQGTIRTNTDLDIVESYQGGQWVQCSKIKATITSINGTDTLFTPPTGVIAYWGVVYCNLGTFNELWTISAISNGGLWAISSSTLGDAISNMVIDIDISSGSLELTSNGTSGTATCILDIL